MADKNLIDLLKIKTFIIYNYKNNNYDINIGNDEYKLVNSSYKDLGNYYEITTTIKDFVLKYITYYSKPIGFNDNLITDFHYPGYILITTEEILEREKYNKLPDTFTYKQISIHFPTQIKGHGVLISTINEKEWIETKKAITTHSNTIFKYSIIDDDIVFKLFYHPEYNNGKHIYGFKYKKANIQVAIDISNRIRKLISY